MQKIKLLLQNRKIKIIIFSLSIILFLVSLGLIVKFFVVEPYENNQTMKELEDIYYEKADEQPEIRGNLMALQGVNPDIKGWIKIKDTVIDYPVLQSSKEDQFYYLYKNYKKIYSGFGSIFIDSLCSIEKPSKNMIMYGHNMRDKSMFGALLNYDNLDYYKERPVIIFDTLQEQGDWKIISVFKTNTIRYQGELFDYLKVDFADDNSFLNFVYDLKLRSLIDTPVDVNQDDYLITLSTCSYELKDFRTVVVARKVRPGESSKVDVDLAKLNPDPLMPEGYYRRYGGTMPKFESFEDALENHHLSWLS